MSADVVSCAIVLAGQRIHGTALTRRGAIAGDGNGPSYDIASRACQTHRTDAEIRNEQFLRALGRYFDNGGRG